MNNLTPKFDNGIPIVFATDEKFIPYLYVAIQSLVNNSSKDNNYDIVILYSNIEEYKRNQFKELERENISVRFYDMTELMDSYKDVWYTHWHYTEAMYYRFFVPQLFSKFSKIVYLDCDIIVNCNIAELYNIDLEDKGIAASIGLARQHENDKHTEYIEKTLNIPKENYFNSGVLLFNIEKLRDKSFFELCINTLKLLREPLFPDQDVLNLIFKNDIKYLDCKYNLTWNVIHYFKDSNEKLSDNIREQFIAACNSPKILHYAGSYKPWKLPHLSYSDYFWKYARKTPFYEAIIYKHCKTVFDKQALYNVTYRKRIYLQYLRCKIMKAITFGNKKKHYSSKAQVLKKMVKDYRKLLKKN